MKLYYSRGACSLSVRITLHEGNIDFTSEAVDLKTKRTASGRDFLEINSKGAVPAIQLDNGEILTENSAILVYLADYYGVKELLPPLSDFRRYRIIEWLSFIAADVHKTCSPIFNADMSEEIREKVFRPLLRKKLGIIEYFLQQEVFLGGDSVSLADNYLFVVLRWLNALKIDRAAFPNLARYFNQMSVRPAVIRALQEEELLQPVQ